MIWISLFDLSYLSINSLLNSVFFLILDICHCSLPWMPRLLFSKAAQNHWEYIAVSSTMASGSAAAAHFLKAPFILCNWTYPIQTDKYQFFPPYLSWKKKKNTKTKHNLESVINPSFWVVYINTPCKLPFPVGFSPLPFYSFLLYSGFLSITIPSLEIQVANAENLPTHLGQNEWPTLKRR